jgi:hypothetical protein
MKEKFHNIIVAFIVLITGLISLIVIGLKISRLYG